MHDTMDEVCVAIDNLMLHGLELMEKEISVGMQMEQLLRDGHIELAKARYIRGKESIGILQVPTEDSQFESVFNVETTFEGDIPHFDIDSSNASNEGEEVQDPIKWFGVLVPQNLRNAQKRFQAALQLAVERANVQAEISSMPGRLKSLRNTRSELLEKEE